MIAGAHSRKDDDVGGAVHYRPFSHERATSENAVKRKFAGTVFRALGWTRNAKGFVVFRSMIRERPKP
jgi:hypothetical protein